MNMKTHFFLIIKLELFSKTIKLNLKVTVGPVEHF